MEEEKRLDQNKISDFPEDNDKKSLPQTETPENNEAANTDSTVDSIRCSNQGSSRLIRSVSLQQYTYQPQKEVAASPKPSCYFFFPFQLLPHIPRQQINIQINKLQINILVHIFIHLMGHLSFTRTEHDEWEVRCFVS